MSRWLKNRLAGRWAGILLLASLLASGQRAAGQALPPVLRRTVAPTPGNRPLGAVLAELSRQSGLPFSYSSSLVPTAARCQLRPGPARPLGEVLREVLRARHLTYGLLDGQLVLWPDRVAAPPSVRAVNGYAAPAIRPASSPPAPAAAAATAAGRATIAPLRPPAAPPRAGVASGAARLVANSRHLASGTKKVLAAGALPPATGANLSGRRAGAVYAAPKSATELLAKAARGKAGHPPKRAGAAGTEPLSAAARAQSAAPALAIKSQDARFPTNAAGRRAAARASQAASLARLPIRPVPLMAPPLAGAPASLPAGPAPTAAGRPTENKPPRDRSSFLRQAYLHGEVWGSESLPLNAAAKLGTQRIYLVLGVATGPFGRRGGLAGGVGLGTAGAAQGRFTPSLDFIYWFLAGDHDEVAHAALAQLRPAVAWQLRQGGRLHLFGGPTLNLATAYHDGNRRWSFGQDQWLWIDEADDQTITRLWPGVQVGLRF